MEKKKKEIAEGLEFMTMGMDAAYNAYLELQDMRFTADPAGYVPPSEDFMAVLEKIGDMLRTLKC